MQIVSSAPYPSLFSKFSSAVLLCLFAFLISQLSGYLLKIDQSAWVNLPLKREQKTDPILFKTLSFSHAQTAVDWLWIRALQDDALSKLAPHHHAASFYDLDLATDIDPLFYEVYYYGGTILSVVRDDFAGSRALLEKGRNFIREKLPNYSTEFREKYWSRAFWISLNAGYVYLFDFNDIVNAKEAFHEASLLPNAPPFLARMSERLGTPEGQIEVGTRVLDALIKIASSNEKLKTELIKKKAGLVLAVDLSRVQKEFEKWNRAKTKNQSRFEQFLTEKSLPAQDRFGSMIFLNDHGKVESKSDLPLPFGIRSLEK